MQINQSIDTGFLTMSEFVAITSEEAMGKAVGYIHEPQGVHAGIDFHLGIVFIDNTVLFYGVDISHNCDDCDIVEISPVVGQKYLDNMREVYQQSPNKFKHHGCYYLMG